MTEDERVGVVGGVIELEEEPGEGEAPKEVLAAGGVSKSRRTGSGQSRYGHRRSPTTGHRVRRNKTPEPNFVPLERKSGEEKKERSRRSKSTPGEARENNGHSRISSSEEEKEKERKPRKITKTKSDSVTRAKLEGSKRLSGGSLNSSDSTVVKNTEAPPKPALRTRSKSRGREENGKNGEDKESSWWKSWPGWTQKLRGKSLERDPGESNKIIAPPRRNRSLERPPVIKEKEKRAALKKEKEKPPVPKKRSKSKSRTSSDDDKERKERRPSVEESSDEFWKSSDGVRKRQVDKQTPKEEFLSITETDSIKNDDLTKQLVLVEAIIENRYSDLNEEETGTSEIKQEKSKLFKDKFLKLKEVLRELRSISLRDFARELRTEWKSFIQTSPNEIQKLKILRNRCLASFVILVMYCGTGAMIFRFTEGAFENFYKCGVKRVKRDFVDALWTSSHNLREEDWKSLARRKLWEFEEQLHTAHEAGMTSYSGLKAWSFLNAFLYCVTVVSTIGYGHISPSTTTGRAITIIYAIFGIPMFLILLADFGKLFTRGIKFIWAFVRRVYYTGSCRKVRRTVPVQEVMKGMQMVYDIATFRRPSQLPPGITLDDMPAPAAPPIPPRPTFTPGEPPGTPALSTYAIDDEFNLPISVAIFILLIYIFCGATVFYVWESWGFFESFYFVFISMSTIGFGDFVPQGLIDPSIDPDLPDDQRPLISPNQMYMMASIVYLVFGLALTSMCINVVQEKLSDSFRQASAKIGATIGLRVAEEDGTVTPVAPAHVEIAEVHNAVSNKAPPTPSAS